MSTIVDQPKRELDPPRERVAEWPHRHRRRSAERRRDDCAEARPDAPDADHPRRSGELQPARRFDISLGVDRVESEPLRLAQFDPARQFHRLDARQLADTSEAAVPRLDYAL